MEYRSERRRKTACYRLCAQVCVHWETRTRFIRTEAASMTSLVRQESKAETGSPPHQHQRYYNPLPPRQLERLPSYCRDILLLLFILILILLLLLFLLLLLPLLLCREASSFCLKLNSPPSSQQPSTTSCQDSAGDSGRPPEDLSASPAALFHLGLRRRRFRVLCNRVLCSLSFLPAQSGCREATGIRPSRVGRVASPQTGGAPTRRTRRKTEAARVWLRARTRVAGRSCTCWAASPPSADCCSATTPASCQAPCC